MTTLSDVLYFSEKNRYQIHCHDTFQISCQDIIDDKNQLKDFSALSIYKVE